MEGKKYKYRMRNGMALELTESEEILGRDQFQRVSYQVKMNIQYSGAEPDDQLIIKGVPH